MFAVLGYNKNSGNYYEIATELQHWATAIEIAKSELLRKENRDLYDWMEVVANYGLPVEKKQYIISIKHNFASFSNPTVCVEPYGSS